MCGSQVHVQMESTCRFLLLLLVYQLALLFLPFLCEASEYYVRPTEPFNSSCLGQPCLTFSQYISDAFHFFQSNTVFKFLPGIHQVNASVMIENIHNISLLAEERRKQPQVITYCPSKCSSNSNAGHCPDNNIICLISFVNATNITVDGLSIMVHPQTNESIENSLWFEYELLFTKISGLYLRYNRVKTAFSNWLCDINIVDSQFIEIHFLEITYGRIILTITDNVYMTTVRAVNCSYCIRMLFTNNTLVYNSMIISANIGIAIYGSNYTAISNTCVATDPTITINFGEYAIVLQHSRNIKLENTEVLDNGIYVSSTTNVDISNVNVVYSIIGYTFYKCAVIILNNATAVNSATCNIYMQEIVNATMTNAVLTSGDETKVQRKEMGIIMTNSSTITITALVFQFFGAPFLTTIDTIRLPAVVQIYDCRNVIISNCTFQANNITSLKLIRSCINVTGRLDFNDNRAYRGAAMVLIHGSSMILTENGYVAYTNNVADDTGGAIYVANTYFYTLETPPTFDFGEIDTLLDEYEVEITAVQKCFVEFDGEHEDVQLLFSNNSASQGGEVLYEESMGLANVHGGSCLKNFRNMSAIFPSTWSAISSDPSRVHFCNKEGIPDFETMVYPRTYFIYPGQTIVISVIVTGHNLGTVAGSVFANFQNALQLGAGQSIQEVHQHQCNKLNYTIFFTQSKEKQIVLTLTAVKNDVRVLQYAQSLIDEYKRGNTHNRQDIQNLPIYVHINLLSCPPGFELTQYPSKCGCKKHLQQLADVTCNIQYLTIQRRGLVWIGPFTDNNNTVIGVITAQNCPLNYCKDESVSITLNQSDKQCNHQHSGTLCGGCQPGLSLVLGSSQCQKCSNKYLVLLIPFAFAGGVLVFFIKILNLTTSKGFINGLVFYANILKPNEHTFLPQMNTNPLTLFIAWLNLDLGIETCFVDGLTAYWKTWLQFVFPFYIWAIAGLIIISARYSIRLARLMGNNSVPVLATLVLFSYAKLLRTIITIMSYSVLEAPHGLKVVWSADGNIDYLGPQHAPLFVAAVATLLFLWVPYTLLLLLGQWIRKIDHKYVTFLLMKMKPFLDAHYGPLKDKHHYWFGVLMCMRVIILLVSTLVPANNFSIFTLSTSITAGALISFTSIGPATYRSSIVSTSEISLFINLGLLGLSKFYTNAAGGNQYTATYTLIGVAFIQFLGLVCYEAYFRLKPLFFHRYTRHDDNEAAKNIWRYNTSMELPLSECEGLDTDTPYHDAATAL